MKTSTRTAFAVTGAVAAAPLVAGIAPRHVVGRSGRRRHDTQFERGEEGAEPQAVHGRLRLLERERRDLPLHQHDRRSGGPPTGDFLPGTKQNLEVPYNFIHDYDSTVTWAIFARRRTAGRHPEDLGQQRR